ncbi:dihydrofolate reductase family protein [Agrococcus sp. ARC_14]|uniref:dihydrofolate reductase family protein n=1 Tax=Agrococcus sp. ARC_14 TaxID=2919927 RepID=UPI001F06DD3C|nr:dihydrofolate reductase family protein [Agrococcus sp. ARC_14]MCH1881834.1 dihydrofolate reductase family protein [Agrococcus sp. ARC_14]
MRLVAHEFMTLDGVMQGPGGAEEDTTGGFRWGGWGATIFDDVVAETVDGWFQHTDALLFGRTTYDMMAAYWPQVTDPDDTVAARLNAAPKHVVTTTLDPADGPWASTTSVIADDVPARIRRLKQQGDGELQVHGSSRLLQTLIAERLLDELRLIVVPTVIGSGKRVFAEATPSGFEVTDARVATNGCVAMTLVPAPFRTATFEVVDGKERMVDERSEG